MNKHDIKKRLQIHIENINYKKEGHTFSCRNNFELILIVFKRTFCIQDHKRS